MIPGSLFGLVIFIALLAPGFVYLERRERHHPGLDYSTLRETSLVVITSLGSLSVVGLVFGFLRLIESPSLPDVLVPDLGAYVEDGDRYVRAHYVEAALWFLVLVGLASLLAAAVAVPPRWMVRALPKKLGAQIERWRGPGAITQRSGWGVALDMHPGMRKMVEVVLTDGSVAFGHLLSGSTQLDETADRDIVLAAPIEMRAAGAENFVELGSAGTMVISAAQIRYFSVAYLEPMVSAANADVGASDVHSPVPPADRVGDSPME